MEQSGCREGRETEKKILSQVSSCEDAWTAEPLSEVVVYTCQGLFGIWSQPFMHSSAALSQQSQTET